MADIYDRIIGYEKEKEICRRIVDSWVRKKHYQELGINTFERGLFFYGRPGSGKTLFATTIAEDLKQKAGWSTYIIRRNTGDDTAFTDEISKTFDKVLSSGGATIILDDIHLFSGEQDNTRILATVQSKIDMLNDKNRSALIIATSNFIDEDIAFDSLFRPQRIGKQIHFALPDSDSEVIIKHFLSKCPLASDVIPDDICRMLTNKTVADVDDVIKEASMIAAYENRTEVNKADLIKSVLSKSFSNYGFETCESMSAQEKRSTSIHECGHLVALASLVGLDYFGFASLLIKGRGEVGGFVNKTKAIDNRRIDTITLLAGRAACEMLDTQYPVPSGCQDDISRAMRNITDGIINSGTHGLGLVEYASRRLDLHDTYTSRIGDIAGAELEKYYQKAKQLISINKDLVLELAESLEHKETLLYSDVAEICSRYEIKQINI